MTGKRPEPQEQGNPSGYQEALNHPALPIASALASLGYQPAKLLWSAALRIYRSPSLSQDLLDYIQGGRQGPAYESRSPSCLFQSLPGGNTVASLIRDYDLSVPGAFLLASDLIAEPEKTLQVMQWIVWNGYWSSDERGMRTLKFPPIRYNQAVCQYCGKPYPGSLSACPNCGGVEPPKDFSELKLEEVQAFVAMVEQEESTPDIPERPVETELPRVTLSPIPTPPFKSTKPPASVTPSEGERKPPAEPAKTARTPAPTAGGSRKMVLYAGVALSIIGILMMAMGSGLPGGEGTPPAGIVPTTKVSIGDTVKVYYSVSFPEGTIFESNRNGTPLEFTVGSGEVIKGFDNAVIGMIPGQTKTVTIPPEDGYGPYKQQLVTTLNTKSVNNTLTKLNQTGNLKKINYFPEIGPVYTWTKDDNSTGYLRFSNITSETTTVDENHPLAGKTLVFEITLEEIVP